MIKRTLTGDFISQVRAIEGDPEVIDKLNRSADTVTLPAVAASGAATSGIIRLGVNNGPR